MKIDGLDIAFKRINPVDRNEEALIRFYSDGVVLQILAKAPRAVTPGYLTRDAIRQLKRMPEFTSGSASLRFDMHRLKGCNIL